MLPVLCPGNPLAKRPIPPPEGGVMQLLSWHGVEVAGVVLTGRMAGYLMALAGLWAGAIPGIDGLRPRRFRTPLSGLRLPQCLVVGWAVHPIC